MKFISAFLILLAFQLCSTGAQAPKKGAGAEKPSKAEAVKVAPAVRKVVAIDPGHPSEVASGRTEQNGTNETRVAWEVAVRLQRILEERGYEVVLTKSAEGELVRNKDRALVANRSRADLMVRLHCDASVERGFAIYYPDRQGRAKDGTTGPTPDVIAGSQRAAEAIHEGMKEHLEGFLNDNGVRTDYQTKVGQEQGGALTGSIFSEVPVVTVEMVVLSDPADAKFIKAEEGQQRMAEALANGIERFLNLNSQVVPRKRKL